jgi:hypothetical protein
MKASERYVQGKAGSGLKLTCPMTWSRFGVRSKKLNPSRVRKMSKLASFKAGATSGKCPNSTALNLRSSSSQRCRYPAARREGLTTDFVYSRMRALTPLALWLAPWRGKTRFEVKFKRGRSPFQADVIGLRTPRSVADQRRSGRCRWRRVQATVTFILSSAALALLSAIFAAHTCGPVLCTDTPSESTATVTGMSAISNS